MNEVAGDELIDGKKENWPAQDGLRETDYQVFRDTDDTMINVELQAAGLPSQSEKPHQFVRQNVRERVNPGQVSKVACGIQNFTSW